MCAVGSIFALRRNDRRRDECPAGATGADRATWRCARTWRGDLPQRATSTGHASADLRRARRQSPAVCLRELRSQLRIGEKRDGARMRRRQARDAVDAHIGIAAKLAAETHCELSERDRHAAERPAACESHDSRRRGAGLLRRSGGRLRRGGAGTRRASAPSPAWRSGSPA